VGECIPVGGLTVEQVRMVLTAATMAPSLHNSQPWRFLCTPQTIELHADLDRTLPATDSDHRGVMLACGAALLNLRLAMRTVGIDADVRLLPDHTQPTLIAVVRPGGPSRITAEDRQLSGAIPRRHTDRRPFLDVPVPEAVRNTLRRAARVEQAWMAIVSSAQASRLRVLLAQAHRTQQSDPQFMAEWSAWTGREAGAPDGVPASSAGPQPEQQDIWVMRDFSAGRAGDRVPGKDFEAEPLLAVIGSFRDVPRAQVQSGQAMQRMLLTATLSGLAASFLSQVIEVPDTRGQLRELIGGGLWPQTVLRLGYHTPTSATPRRDLGAVLEPPGRIASAFIR
jgi:nitroreductase